MPLSIPEVYTGYEEPAGAVHKSDGVASNMPQGRWVFRLSNDDLEQPRLNTKFCDGGH